MLIHYFAYGSNMSLPRLQQRVPSAQPLSTAALRCHRLAFHKAGRDGSAKCDAFQTRDTTDVVYGVIYTMHKAHEPRLDKAEDLGRGYEQKRVEVQLASGESMIALTYVASLINRGLRPYTWYLEHVMRGATEHALPEQYRAAIASVITTEDPDKERYETELAIYE